MPTPLPAPTYLELTLVGLAAGEPRSGYDLKTIFETTAMGQFSSSPGSIYPALKRLERRGLLRSVLDRAGGDRRRRVYRPTPAGMAALRTWITAAVTPEELRDDSRLPILRFSLAGTVTPTAAETRRFLQTYRASLDVFIEELRTVGREFESIDDPHPWLAILHGVDSLLAQRRWIAKAERALEESHETTARS